MIFLNDKLNLIGCDNKMKRFINKNKYKFIVLICLLFGGISYAGATIYFAASNVTYSNSALDATNVQDAIEELHAVSKECVPMTGERMLSKLGVTPVTSGNGLYADSVESGRYIYRGPSFGVNNYICLDTKSSGSCAAANLYRIIAIESDGTLKVIKNAAISSTIQWDPGYYTSISGVTSASNINGTRKSGTSTDYCYVSSNSRYSGCKSWGSSTSTYASDGTTPVTVMPWVAGSSTTKTLPTHDAYLNVYLNGGKYLTTSSSGNSTTSQTITGWISSQNATIKNNIVEYLYNVGPLKSTSGQTIATDVSQEAAYKWKGKVALMNASDFVRASTNSACTGAYAYQSISSCYDTGTNLNWLIGSNYQWTLSPCSGSDVNYVWIVNSDEYLTSTGDTSDRTNFNYTVRPVFHLSSDINITGSGTNDANVYRVSS